MTETRRLYRSNNAVIAGVCSGIADYFGVSTTLIRVIAAVLLVVGLGAPTVVYLVLVLVLPKRPTDYSSYVDVDPISFKQARASAPVPPAGAQAASRDAGPACPTSSSSPGAGYSAAYCTTANARAQDENPKQRRYTFAVLCGMLLVAIGFGNLLGRFIPTIHWWTFWPLLVVALGISHLCTCAPGPGRRTPARVLDGIAIMVFGLMLLAITLGVLDWGIFRLCLDLWPALLAIAGVAVVGVGMRSSVVRCVASLLLVAYLIFVSAYWLMGANRLYDYQVVPDITETVQTDDALTNSIQVVGLGQGSAPGGYVGAWPLGEGV